MTLNGEMAVIVRYPTEFGSRVKLCLALGLDAFWYWFLADVNSRSRSLYAMEGPSVCRLSVVCDVGAPYSAG